MRHTHILTALLLAAQQASAKFVYPILTWQENAGPNQKLPQTIQSDVRSIDKYRLQSNNPDTFRLETKTINGARVGELYVLKSLDREKQDKYTLMIEGIDANGQVVEPQSPLIVQVQDANDNAPRITNKPGEIYKVAENLKNHNVFKINVEDADASEYYGAGNKSIVYFPPENMVRYGTNGREEVISNPHDWFKVEPNGMVKTAQNSKIDRETTEKFTFDLYVRDGGTGSWVIQHNTHKSRPYKATVEVGDVNDNKPVFGPEIRSAYKIGELATSDTEIGIIKLTDKDATIDNQKVVFTLSTHGNVFKIVQDHENPTWGKLLVKKGGIMDYETTPKYSVPIVARNEAKPNQPVRATITVDVTDENECPIFTNKDREIITTVTENKQPTYSTQIKAVDKDTILVGMNAQTVTYKIADGSDPLSYWTIDENTGQLTLMSKVDREASPVHIDRKATPARYTVQVEACDNYNPQACCSKDVTLQINDENDNAPEFVQDDEFKTSQVVRVCYNIEDRYNQDGDWYKLKNAMFLVGDQDSYKAKNGAPFVVKVDESQSHEWKVEKNSAFSGGEIEQYIIYTKKPRLPHNAGDGIKVTLNMKDNNGNAQDRILKVNSCSCNEQAQCSAALVATGSSTWVLILVILLAIFITVIIIILFVWRHSQKQKTQPPFPDHGGGTLVHYDGHAGMEDAAVDDVPLLPYKKPVMIPDNPPENISEFIRTAKEQADNDPSAPPYDSLLTFDYEGAGSTAGSLSSLCSATTDRSVDYAYLHEWGPRFQKLAEIYTYEED